MGNETTPERLLLSARDLCHALGGISVSTLYAWQSAGRLPGPLHVGGRTLWRADEIEQWIEAGCPSREKFEAGQGARR